ncbi:MAG: ATP-binding cassette domain-containing protein, partial [Pseudomonadota bacterium]
MGVPYVQGRLTWGLDDPDLATTRGFWGLTVGIGSERGVFNAVDTLSLKIKAGEVLGLVGESGCGKSITALSIMRLVPDPPGRTVGGQIRMEGRNLLDLGEEEMRDIRGNEISMIFQEPMTSLNPVYTIGEQIAEVLRRHKGLGASAAWSRAIELLDAVR